MASELPRRPPSAGLRLTVHIVRLFQALASSLILAVAPFAAVAQAAGASAWDHPGYDAEDSYYNPHESAINLSTIGSLTRRWSVPLRKLGEGGCAGYSAPLAVGGRIIATDELGISAYDAATGASAWHFNWADPTGTETPTIAADGNTLIAATTDCFSQRDPDGTILALDLSTGRLRWRVERDAPAFSLVVDKGMAVVWGESPSDELATVAYRVADGKVAWRKAGFQSANVSANGRLLLADTHNSSAVDIATGAPLWAKKGFWQAKAATPASDRFLVTNGKSLSAVSAATGAVLWTARGGTNDLLATDGRRVFRANGHSIEALSAATGHSLWARLLSEEMTQPVRAGGLLYVGGPILDPATGALFGPVHPGAQIINVGRVVSVNQGFLSSYSPGAG